MSTRQKSAPHRRPRAPLCRTTRRSRPRYTAPEYHPATLFLGVIPGSCLSSARFPGSQRLARSRSSLSSLSPRPSRPSPIQNSFPAQQSSAPSPNQRPSPAQLSSFHQTSNIPPLPSPSIDPHSLSLVCLPDFQTPSGLGFRSRALSHRIASRPSPRLPPPYLACLSAAPSRASTPTSAKPSSNGLDTSGKREPHRAQVSPSCQPAS